MIASKYNDHECSSHIIYWFMIYENILPPELESDLSLSHSSIEREKDPQKFLIMTLHRDLNLTLY